MTKYLHVAVPLWLLKLLLATQARLLVAFITLLSCKGRWRLLAIPVWSSGVDANLNAIQSYGQIQIRKLFKINQRWPVHRASFKASLF
jgi:hypothetical protein